MRPQRGAKPLTELLHMGFGTQLSRGHLPACPTQRGRWLLECHFPPLGSSDAISVAPPARALSLTVLGRGQGQAAHGAGLWAPPASFPGQ